MSKPRDMGAPSASPAPMALIMPPALPVHPRAPVAAGIYGMNVFLRLDDKMLAFKPAQLTRRCIVALYAACPDLPVVTWPNRRCIGGWDAMRAAESIIIACGDVGMLWPEALEREGFNIRYRWRCADGRFELVTPAELCRRTDAILGRAAS